VSASLKSRLTTPTQPDPDSGFRPSLEHRPGGIFGGMPPGFVVTKGRSHSPRTPD
jgi:hypothetical protein